MAWQLNGTYFETCSCDAVCPCTWSGLSAEATLDRCRALLAFHVDRGELEGTDVSGLSWAMLLDTPKLMSDGDWRVGIYLDANASEEQAGKLGQMLGGELGGPPALLGPLIGEMLGVESVPITYEDDGRVHRVKIGDDIRMEVEDFVPPAVGDGPPVQLTNVFHPAASTLTVAPAKTAEIKGFGIEFGRAGESGFSAPFSWAG